MARGDEADGQVEMVEYLMEERLGKVAGSGIANQAYDEGQTMYRTAAVPRLRLEP